jgi:two-component system, response regulator
MIASKRFILLVEDSQDDEVLVTRALKRVAPNCETVVARDADQAMGMLLHETEELPERPAVMLVDIGLPKVGGLELVERVRSNDDTRDLPVFVLTASAHHLDVQMSQRLGANGYIHKPIRYEEMVSALESLEPLLA